MKKGVHPDYRPVVFRDRSGGLLLLTRSTLASGRDGRPVETIEYEGATYPVIDVDVSSASHPFWTGRARHVDTEGRVEKFQRRYGGRSATPPAGSEEGEQP